MKHLLILIALMFATTSLAQQPYKQKARGLDQDHELCVNVDSVETCPIRLEGSTGKIFILGSLNATGLNQISLTADASPQDVMIMLGEADSTANIRGENGSGVSIRGGGSGRGGEIILHSSAKSTDPDIVRFDINSTQEVVVENNGVTVANGLTVGGGTLGRAGFFKTEAATGVSCDTECQADEVAKAGFDSDSGTCLTAWSSSSGANQLCSSSGAFSKTCLCMGLK